jgi:hypothetical protein
LALENFTGKSACTARAAERAQNFARSYSPGTYIDVLLAQAKTC